MKVLTFLGRFFGTSLKVTGAGILGTYVIGWKQPFPISWVWVFVSIIGGFIASRCGVGILKIIIACFAWPVAFWLAFGIFLGLGIASYETTSHSQKSEI